MFWSCGPYLTSSCQASLAQSVSLPLATANPSWPAGTPRARRGSRRQVGQSLCGDQPTLVNLLLDVLTKEIIDSCNAAHHVHISTLPCLPGVLAMEALHRQVLPFLLRRMKEDVLQDLPPKIIQDYYCTLSPLQVPFQLPCSLLFTLSPLQYHSCCNSAVFSLLAFC